MSDGAEATGQGKQNTGSAPEQEAPPDQSLDSSVAERERESLPKGPGSSRPVVRSHVEEPKAEQEAPLTAQSLLAMVIEDMEICWGERGSEYAFQDLSTETVDAIVAHIGGRRVE